MGGVGSLVLLVTKQWLWRGFLRRTTDEGGNLKGREG